MTCFIQFIKKIRQRKISFLILLALTVTLWEESSAAIYEKQLLITAFTVFEFRPSSMNMHNVLRCHFFTPIKNLIYDFMYGILSHGW